MTRGVAGGQQGTKFVGQRGGGGGGGIKTKNNVIMINY